MKKQKKQADFSNSKIVLTKEKQGQIKGGGYPWVDGETNFGIEHEPNG